MRQTWRWFGPEDSVSTNDMRQAGVEGVVSALHHIPNGAVWTIDEIEARQAQIAQFQCGRPSNLTWEVVESLPVSEDIKQQSGQWRQHIENYKLSLENLAQCGLKVICYNFMPLLDWTRTDLAYTLANGARCMRFDLIDFAAFDIHILKRKNARADFSEAVCVQADQRIRSMSEEAKLKLSRNIVCGLPGAEQGYTVEDLRAQIALYDRISEDQFRQHQLDFLNEIVPLAEHHDLRMCCHPDDPPFSLLGLHRIMSSEEDYKQLTQAIDSPANGITLCSGSLGVSAEVDLPGMMERLGDKVHFIHLRNVVRESVGEQLSFYEAAHLEGETNMVSLIQAILNEENRRKLLSRVDCSIPFRPDHGQDILSDLTVNGQPGYPAVGRLKGLAELRGIMTALEVNATAG
ncbi:MAG: mannonate dehydratase [Granulosicoccus sp.]